MMGLCRYFDRGPFFWVKELFPFLSYIPCSYKARNSHDHCDDGKDPHPLEGLSLFLIGFIKFSDGKDYNAGDKDHGSVDKEQFIHRLKSPKMLVFTADFAFVV